jgi:hypothetical protein
VALLPDVLEGRIEPGRVFDRVVRLDEVPDCYRAMNNREAIKVLIEFLKRPLCTGAAVQANHTRITHGRFERR